MTSAVASRAFVSMGVRSFPVDDSTIAATNARAHCASTRAGWVALVERNGVLSRVFLGHSTFHSLATEMTQRLEGFAENEWAPDLMNRVQAYLEGAQDDFRDVPVHFGTMTPFRRDVLEYIRTIPPGDTLSYAQVGERLGRPQAARAIGGCMAANPVPLIVPCHRIVGSGGKLGGYTNPMGLDLKRRLLKLEAEGVWSA